MFWESRLSPPIRTPEDLVALYEANRAENDAVKAREEVALLLEQPGWRRVTEWLSSKRDNAFQQLRNVGGTRELIAESFLKWQIVDSIYEDIEQFIKQTIEQGEEILHRRDTNLEEQFLREQLHGRDFDATDDSGSAASPAGDSAGSANY